MILTAGAFKSSEKPSTEKILDAEVTVEMPDKVDMPQLETKYLDPTMYFNVNDTEFQEEMAANKHVKFKTV